MNKPEILIIEDENAMARLLSTVMHTNSYNYRVARNGREGLALALTRKPDVILTDLGLPDMDGLEIIRNVRSWSNMPIIVVSGRSEDMDKVEALDAGADDYITKPFSIDELMARIRVALRHGKLQSQAGEEKGNIYENGNLTIDYAAGCVFVNGVEIHLTPIEYRILMALALNTGRVMTHNMILKEVWGNLDKTEMPSLRVFITNIRRKLSQAGAEEMIATHVGVGYRMTRSDK